MLAAMTILSAVGEIERFATPKNLVGFAANPAELAATAHLGITPTREC
jgi:hypothetical protein